MPRVGRLPGRRRSSRGERSTARSWLAPRARRCKPTTSRSIASQSSRHVKGARGWQPNLKFAVHPRLQVLIDEHASLQVPRKPALHAEVLELRSMTMVGTPRMQRSFDGRCNKLGDLTCSAAQGWCEPEGTGRMQAITSRSQTEATRCSQHASSMTQIVLRQLQHSRCLRESFVSDKFVSSWEWSTAQVESSLNNRGLGNGTHIDRSSCSLRELVQG